MDRFSTKQPSEAYYVEFDFESAAGSTAALVSATVAARIFSTGVDATATITTAASQVIAGQSVFVWVKAGSDATDYQITCVATASDGSIYELEGMLLVAALPLTTPSASTGPGIVIAPTAEPVSLAEIKAHLRVDETADDELLNELVQGAREHVEDITRRAIMTQTWDFVLHEFPRKPYIKLPYGNLQSVTSMTYKDSDGVVTTLTQGTDYLVETNGEQCGRIVLPCSGSWPSAVFYSSNPICIRYSCGWTSAAAVPKKIKTAIKMIVADMYEGRGDAVIGQTVVENNTALRLLSSARLWDEFS